MEGTRTESDLLGSMALPEDTLYGIQTARAMQHFDAAGEPVRIELIRAFALVKKACARANAECGYLDAARAEAIMRACDEVMAGGHDRHFPVDALQGGAGTSTNMNVNEVVARLAERDCGLPVSPGEHVNLHQSTNDTYPTALRVAAMYGLQRLERSIVRLQDACQRKEREFADVVKLGRTQLRDAVPTTLGREFGAWATALARDRWRIFKSLERLRVVNLGGTAIGTGIAAPRRYIFLATDLLREISGLGISRAENMIDATQNLDPFIEVSGMLRAYAGTLAKMARDLRLMSSGPHGGLGEIELPALQPGSSLMPGKINPVLPEMAMQVAFRVMAHDQEIALAAMSGELELNAFLPLIADALLRSIGMLERCGDALAPRCIDGIRARADRCRELLERSQETITALIPVIGHDAAVDLARSMSERGCSIREAVRERGLLPDEELDRLLSAEHLCRLGFSE